VNNLLISLVSALVTTNQPVAVTNSIAPATNAVAVATNTAAAAEKELHELMEKDDDVMAEVDRWIKENEAFAAQGAGVPANELNQRIRKRLETVYEGYRDFIKRYPTNAEVRLAYASMLDNVHDDDAVFEQLDKARELAPKNPAVWNQLANYHGHTGDPKLAFDYYAKAIELDPTEATYYHNFGTTVFLFRKDVMEHYSIDEKQVFQKALDLYAQAVKLDPTNFWLASDVAQTYYGIKPMRTEEALQSWTNTLRIAHDEIEREGVYIHLARVKFLAGRYAEARAHLNAVTNAMYGDLKTRLTRNLNEREAEAKGTNTPPATAK